MYVWIDLYVHMFGLTSRDVHLYTLGLTSRVDICTCTFDVTSRVNMLVCIYAFGATSRVSIGVCKLRSTSREDICVCTSGHRHVYVLNTTFMHYVYTSRHQEVTTVVAACVEQFNEARAGANKTILDKEKVKSITETLTTKLLLDRKKAQTSLRSRTWRQSKAALPLCRSAFLQSCFEVCDQTLLKVPNMCMCTFGLTSRLGICTCTSDITSRVDMLVCSCAFHVN